MRQIAFFLVLLGLLAAAPAPAHATGWPFWLGKPERHGSRKVPGDYTHVRGSYRYHSRNRQGFFSFLRFGSRQPGLARHRAPHRHWVAARPRPQRTSGRL